MGYEYLFVMKLINLGNRICFIVEIHEVLIVNNFVCNLFIQWTLTFLNIILTIFLKKMKLWQKKICKHGILLGLYLNV